MDARGTTRGWTRGRSEVVRTSKGFVAWLPAKAEDTLVVDALLLVVFYIVA